MKKLLLACMMVPVLGANAQTVKKVILEDLTGVKCGWCPEGAVMAEDLYKAKPSTFIPVAIHTGSYTSPSSPLRTAHGDAINTMLKPYGYPAGAVDRKNYPPGHVPGAPQNYDKWTGLAMSRGVWQDAINVRMALDGVVSVSFSNMKKNADGSYEADVNAKFTKLPAAGVPLKLQVYILEDSIRATKTDALLAQDNYSANVQAGASPLDPWYHNNVLRTSLLNVAPDYYGDGTTIPAVPALNTVYTKHIKFTPDAAWKAKQLRVLAFVAYNGDGTLAADKKEIINADQVYLKSFFPTGVEQTKAAVSMMAYPNPARVSDVIRLQYNIEEGAKVTMTVTNALGQVVGAPYVSEETAGSHIIQWSAADYNLPAGMYIMQVSTPNGSQSQKVNIF